MAPGLQLELYLVTLLGLTAINHLHAPHFKSSKGYGLGNSLTRWGQRVKQASFYAQLRLTRIIMSQPHTWSSAKATSASRPSALYAQDCSCDCLTGQRKGSGESAQAAHLQ